MCLYLSKIILSPRSRQVLRDLASPYELHRTIMRAFPARDDGGPGRVLFRLEPPHDGQPPIVLVQSEKQPDWTALHAIDSYLLESATKTWEPVVRPGQQLRFRLRANPTVKRDGKRHGLLKTEDQLKWFTRKTQAIGVRPLGLITCRQTRWVSSKKDSAGERIQPVHLGVDFEGVLEVIAPAMFVVALPAGVGSAKGFGFGLLSVAPA